MSATDIRLAFLAEADPLRRVGWERDLQGLGLAPGQERFTRPAAAVLEAARQDPTREVFVVLARCDGAERVVGVGVLQRVTGDGGPHVLLRGYSIDPSWQGRGIGTSATRIVVGEAARRFPDVPELRLTVHVDNAAGLRVYERCGLRIVGDLVAGRAGPEHVMVCRLPRPAQV